MQSLHMAQQLCIKHTMQHLLTLALKRGVSLLHKLCATYHPRLLSDAEPSAVTKLLPKLQHVSTFQRP